MIIFQFLDVLGSKLTCVLLTGESIFDFECGLFVCATTQGPILQLAFVVRYEALTDFDPLHTGQNE